MEIKSIEQIKDEVAQADNFHNWQILFESCTMYDYARLEKAINEVAERYAQQFKDLNAEILKEIIDIKNRMEVGIIGYDEVELILDELITKAKEV